MLRIRLKKRTLVNAPAECCFWLCDGQVLCNLKDLQAVLASMSEETFGVHVNAEKNDFAKWVEDVLQDSPLANEMRRVKTRKTALNKVVARLKKYS